MQYTGPAFLFGGRHQPVFGDLLASLPGKDAVDKMVQRYFNDYDPSTRGFNLAFSAEIGLTFFHRHPSPPLMAQMRM